MQKSSSYRMMSCVQGYIGLGCLIMGIIGDAFNRVLGLESISWFLIAIGLFVLGLWHWLEWAQPKKEG